jgi:hypothetical protein
MAQGVPIEGHDLQDALERTAGWVAEIRAAGTTERLRLIGRRDALAAARTLARGLPRVEAAFSDSPAGTELRDWFDPRRVLPLDRAPVALLHLPADATDYLRGRSRQALRTNLTHARAAGLTCAPASSAEQVWDCVHRIAARRGQTAEHVVLRRPRPGLVRDFAIAWDAAGEPVALVETIQDGGWAGLAVLVSAHGHPDALLARYALLAHAVGDLVERGARALVVGGSMLLTEPGVRYFQRRTGFVPVWLRPAPTTAPSTRRRALTGAPTLGLEDLLPAVRGTRPA